MNYILQHRDEYYYCPELGASCAVVGKVIIVKERMGQQHDTRQVFIYLVLTDIAITNVCSDHTINKYEFRNRNIMITMYLLLMWT